MREKPLVLPLNSSRAAKSFLRMAKNILRNVNKVQDSCGSANKSMTAKGASPLLLLEHFGTERRDIPLFRAGERAREAATARSRLR